MPRDSIHKGQQVVLKESEEVDPNEEITVATVTVGRVDYTTSVELFY